MRNTYTPTNLLFTSYQYAAITEWGAKHGIDGDGERIKQLLFRQLPVALTESVFPPTRTLGENLQRLKQSTAAFGHAWTAFTTDFNLMEDLIRVAEEANSLQKKFIDQWPVSKIDDRLVIKSAPLKLLASTDLMTDDAAASNRYNHKIGVRFKPAERSWLDLAGAKLHGATLNGTVRYLIFGDRREVTHRVNGTRAAVGGLLHNMTVYRNQIAQAVGVYYQTDSVPQGLMTGLVLASHICDRLSAALEGRDPIELQTIVDQALQQELVTETDYRTLKDGAHFRGQVFNVEDDVAADERAYVEESRNKPLNSAVDILCHFEGGDR